MIKNRYSKEGTYEVTYSAKDSSGNKTIAKRKIEVIKKSEVINNQMKKWFI